METVNGYRLESEWKNSQCGKTAIASRGGKKYFLKKYQTPVAPIDNKTLDAKTFAHNKELFEKFVKLRKSINTQVRALTGAPPHQPRFMFADSLLPSFQQPACRQTASAGCFFFAAEPLRYADSCTLIC